MAGKLPKWKAGTFSCHWQHLQWLSCHIKKCCSKVTSTVKSLLSRLSLHDPALQTPEKLSGGFEAELSRHRMLQYHSCQCVASQGQWKWAQLSIMILHIWFCWCKGCFFLPKSNLNYSVFECLNRLTDKSLVMNTRFKYKTEKSDRSVLYIDLKMKEGTLAQSVKHGSTV